MAYKPTLKEARIGDNTTVSIPKIWEPYSARGIRTKGGNKYHYVIYNQSNDYTWFSLFCKEGDRRKMVDGDKDGGLWGKIRADLQCKSCTQRFKLFEENKMGEKARVTGGKDLSVHTGMVNTQMSKLSEDRFTKGKVTKSTTHKRKWDTPEGNVKGTFYLSSDVYQMIIYLIRGKKIARWYVPPRERVGGEWKYRKRTKKRYGMGRAEFNPSENPTRRGTKPGKMSFQIRRAIFLLIQPDRASQLLISNQSESESKIMLSSITGLFPIRGKNAPQSKQMISKLESGVAPSGKELEIFSDKIWMTALSRLIDMEIRDSIDEDIIDAGGKKGVQVWLPDFSVVVWELLQELIGEMRKASNTLSDSRTMQMRTIDDIVKCPECNSINLEHDVYRGETVCEKCGSVVVDKKPEKRLFD